MFLFLFSVPPNKERTEVLVWQTFFTNIFYKQTTRNIAQTIANLIKPELKSKRSKLFVSETLYGYLSNFTKLRYGKFDILMSTKSELKKRQERSQFKNMKDHDFASLMLSNELQVPESISNIGTFCID